MGFEPMPIVKNEIKMKKNRKNVKNIKCFKIKMKKIEKTSKILYCQEWDSNPCPFGPVPETGALDQLGHLDLMLMNPNVLLLL